MPDINTSVIELYVGQRIKYFTSRHPYPRYHFASMTSNMVMRLSRPDSEFITGTVTKINYLSGICIRPDGWPLPEDIPPGGFCSAVEKWIEPLENTSIEQPGILCTRSGMELTAEQIRDEVQRHIASR